MIVDLLSKADGRRAAKLLEGAGLCFEEDIDELVGGYQGDALMGTAARQGNVLKMFALDPAAQGGSLLGELASELLRRAFAAGHDSVFVFTKPEFVPSFEQLNFELLAAAGAAALLEHGGGLRRYLEAHRHLVLGEPIENNKAAVVVNANPFSLGHRYLVEEAAQRCETLYVFVVEEDRSAFPYAVRRRLVEEGVADLPNVRVLGSGAYAVSAQTFPAYFLKRDEDVPALQMEIDLTLFGERIAPFFGIGRRFVGHEPYCATTRQYNETMERVLTRCGVEVEVLERRKTAGSSLHKGRSPFISATRVRELLREQGPQAAELRELVPETTLDALQSDEGRAIVETLRRSPHRHA